MAKTRHNNLLDTIDEIITDAKNKGIIHLYTEDEAFTGRKVQINGRSLYHFGTTGYLGLEQDIRLKEAAIDAIIKYGTQFPLSKTYLSFGIYKELEECLLRMYGHPVLVSKNSTLAHIGVIPSIVRDEDAVILDHQVHASAQNACQLLKPRGIHVDMIRHSNLQMLEDKIKEFGNKYNKIWYMVDGVYSMYGDCAPIPELIQLLEKYPRFHLYVDDVHGMSWAGKHGTGYVMSQMKKLHPKMVLVATLSKSFGASGGIIVFPDEELYRKVKTFGGPQTFSAQLEPPMVAAALASAKIHLSDEIYDMQQELATKINYCNSLLRQTDVPLVEENKCPVFFIGTGLPATGYNFVSRLMNEGFYVNLGVFPAVPVKNTGVRFTISRHNRLEDIEKLVDAIKYHYPKALADENRTQNQVRKAFNLPLIEEKPLPIAANPTLTLQHCTSISAIDQQEWNDLLGGNGSFDWQGLQFMEEVFSGNQKPEDNWEFHYYMIRDCKQKPVLATFFTINIWKEDMLAPASISQQLEEKRKNNLYHLTSPVVNMGSLLTEGQHLYIDKNNSQWREAMIQLLDAVSAEQERTNASMIVLRDFEDTDTELKNFLIDQGYFKVDVPDTSIVENLTWSTPEEFQQTLSANSKAKFKKDVLRNEHYFSLEVKKNRFSRGIKKILSTL